MTERFLNIGVFFLISNICVAQQVRPKIFVGIDLLRSTPLYFERGYTIEPSLIYCFKNGWIFDAAAGFTNISHSKIYANMSYKNDGMYWRLALRKEIGANFDIGLGLGRSSFEESGEVVFFDKVFGDYTLRLTQSNTLYFLEPSLSYRIKLGSRFSLTPQYRVPIVLSSYNEQSFPVYAAPGIGDMQLLGSGSSAKSSPSTIAISIRLTYKITND